jgi:hypothetical protein
VVVGIAPEAGIARGAGKNAAYRQTWVAVAHASIAVRPLALQVRVKFDDEQGPHQREVAVAPGDRWALNLDELRSAPLPGWVNASIELRADQRCAATVALWHQPADHGGSVPTVYPIPFFNVETS